MFKYRIAYGCWLNDSRFEPIADEDWPSVRIDEATLHSLDRTLAFLSEAGYTHLDVFGLVTNHSWESDIASTVSPGRAEAVKRVTDIVHRHGLRLIYGLGVYSWGFDKIIARDREVRGSNPQVLCASKPRSHELMRQVVDFIGDRFEVDGFHLEAADQGRCRCDACMAIGDDIDYYNRINRLTAEYIRERWPEKTLLVNTSGYLPWGDTFTRAQLAQMQELCGAVDVFIDVGSHGPFVAEADRKAFAQGCAASFGTANGFWIYPPQKWARDRWLIPHFRHNMAHLSRLYSDGGTGCELFLSPINNPGAEITLMCAGLLLKNPSASHDEILQEAVDRLYRPENRRQQEEIAGILTAAEELFFSCWNPVRNRQVEDRYSDGVENVFLWSESHPERAMPGELFLDRLFGDGAGFPCYLAVHFTAEGRRAYGRGMQALLERIRSAQAPKNTDKMKALEACANNALGDIATATRALG